MSVAKLLNEESLNTHVVDILGNIKGRDQPIMLMKKAIELVSTLGRELLIDDDIVFLDPFCKGGEILLACAFARNIFKSQDGNQLIDVQKIQDDMFKGNRYFALAPDERHFRLSLRTFLGNEKSHNEMYANIIRNGNYLSETDGKLDEIKFKKEFENMIEHIKKTAGSKRIIAVGNPPYQEADEGFGGSASAIYNYFVETLIANIEISEFVVVIPSRWFSAGKGTEEFRKKIVKSKNIKSIHYFQKSKEVFPSVDVLGGVCFFHFDRKYNGKVSFCDKSGATEIDLSQYDIIPDDPKAYPLISKIKSKWKDQWVSDVALARKPFGIPTDYFKKNKSLSKDTTNALPCYSRGRKIQYVDRTKISKNIALIEDYKVVTPAAYAPGSKQGVRRVTLPVDQYFIIEKGTITAETYTVIHTFKKRSDAEKFVKYLQTDFARYLLGLRKITQHIPPDRWTWVPLIPAGEEWTEEKINKFFGLTKDEQEHIKKKVKEWS